MSIENKILVLSEDLDYHGHAIMWGLDQLGASADWWDRSLFPKEARNSIWLSNTKNTKFSATNSNAIFSNNEYKTIWNRRGGKPEIDSSLTKTDKRAARHESSQFLRGAMEVLVSLNPNALVVNSLDSGRTAANKLYQLHMAKAVGFNIPTTLMSNNASDIRAFLLENDEKVVAKMHFPFSWRTRDDELHISATTKISMKDVSDDFSLECSPMIYQKTINIANELRVIVFGKSIFAINQERANIEGTGTFNDVRYEKTKVTSVKLEATLAELCLKYMKALDLSYAAFDIAQTDDGQFIFIEANESGQFLFLEDLCPELPLLDAYCQFLHSGDRGFIFKESKGITFDSFHKTQIALDFHKRNDLRMKDVFLPTAFELVE